MRLEISSLVLLDKAVGIYPHPVFFFGFLARNIHLSSKETRSIYIFCYNDKLFLSMISFINAFLRYYISLEKTLPLIQTTKLHNGKWPKERISPALFFWGNIHTVIWIVYSPRTRWKLEKEAAALS